MDAFYYIDEPLPRAASAARFVWRTCAGEMAGRSLLQAYAEDAMPPGGLEEQMFLVGLEGRPVQVFRRGDTIVYTQLMFSLN